MEKRNASIVVAFDLAVVAVLVIAVAAASSASSTVPRTIQKN
jgi:hypothetical protein